MSSRVGALAAAAALAAASVCCAAAAPPAITVIGDSVAAALPLDGRAESILSDGLRIDLEAVACRRIELPSCSVAGREPPTLLQLVRERGSSLGPVVVVAVGYNDWAEEYPRALRDALAAFRRAGVSRVFWLTYRASHHDYLHMNDILRRAARRDPELTVLDWNRYSRSHPAWFAGDGIHLTRAGATALAVFLHARLVALLP